MKHNGDIIRMISRRTASFITYLFLVSSALGNNFDFCCKIKAFNVEPCMIKGGLLLDNFSSKDKVADFPILNNTYSLNCKMNSDLEASYVLTIDSESEDIMDNPFVDITKIGLVDSKVKDFSMNFSCLQTQKVFINVDILLKYQDDTSDKFNFFMAKNCSMPPVAKTNSHTIVLYAVVGVLAAILILVIIISVVCYVRIKRRSENQQKNMGMNMLNRHGNGYEPLPNNASAYAPSNSYTRQQPYTGSFLSEPQFKMVGGGMLPPSYNAAPSLSNELKIPRSSVVFDTFLQSGSIGVVYMATYTRDATLNQRSTVLAKTLKDEACTPESVSVFLKEAVILEMVAHPNILSVTGIVHDDMKPPVAIYPYMKAGNLHQLLHLARPTQSNPNTLTLADQVHMMICIARGMEALSRKNVHGDLATRNCVVGNDLVVKIADSALSRDLFPNDYHELPQRPGSPKFPLKWMAVECLTDLLYSTMSDVWAFGVTFWEVLTLGEVPYIDIPPEALITHLTAGWRLMQPEGCTDELFALLVRCWSANPDDRLSFTNILAQLEAIQCKGAMGAYRPSALEAILKHPAPSPAPLSDSDHIQV